MPKKLYKMQNKQLSDSEQHQYYVQAMAHAKERLEAYRKAGDTQGEQKAQEVINDIALSMKLKEQCSKN